MDCFQKGRDWLVSVQVKVYRDHQGLLYFNIMQKLNCRQASWYLYMSEFNYHIFYKHGLKIGKLDGQSRCSEEEKCEIVAHFLYEGQLLALTNNNIGEEENVQDVELDVIDVAI